MVGRRLGGGAVAGTFGPYQVGAQWSRVGSEKAFSLFIFSKTVEVEQAACGVERKHALCAFRKQANTSSSLHTVPETTEITDTWAGSIATRRPLKLMERCAERPLMTSRATRSKTFGRERKQRERRGETEEGRGQRAWEIGRHDGRQRDGNEKGRRDE